MPADVSAVQELIGCINRGDKDGLAELLDEDIECRDLRRAPDTPEVVRGRKAVAQVLSVWMDAFDDFRAEVAEYIPHGDWLLCPTTWRARGKGSDIEIALVATGAYLCRDGKACSAIFGNDSRDSARTRIREREEYGRLSA